MDIKKSYLINILVIFLVFASGLIRFWFKARDVELSIGSNIAPLFGGGIFVIILVTAFGFSYYRSKKGNKIFSDFAMRYGLKHIPHSTFGTRGSISGRYRGFSVVMSNITKGYGKSRKQLFCISFGNLGLPTYKEFLAVPKWLKSYFTTSSASKEVTRDNQQIDKKYSLTADDPSLLKKILDDVTMIRLIENKWLLELKTCSINVVKEGYIKNVSEMEEIFRFGLKLAERLRDSVNYR